MSMLKKSSLLVLVLVSLFGAVVAPGVVGEQAALLIVHDGDGNGGG